MDVNGTFGGMAMKQWRIVFLVLLLCAPSASGLAESSFLYPARGENGKWGYINDTGAFVIAPRYADVSPARGSPNGPCLFMAVSEDGINWGLINSLGDEILPREYVIIWNEKDFAVYTAESEDIIAAVALETGAQKSGFFDADTGTFSGFRWKQIELDAGNMPLLPVLDDSGLWGYANTDPSLGPMETVIPCQFSNACGFFRDGDAGWAIAGYASDDAEISTAYVLVNADGHVVHPPEGYMLEPYNSRVSEGKSAVYTIPVYDDERRTLSEQASGFMDTAGNLLWADEAWYEVYPYDHGWAVALSHEGGYAYLLDGNGKALKGVHAHPEDIGGHDFVCGQAAVFAQGSTGNAPPAAINEQGEIMFRLEGEQVFWLWSFMDNGLAWYMEWHPEAGEHWYQQQQYGLVDREGNLVTPSDYFCGKEEGAPFSCGLAAVRYAQGDGLYGYLNEQGQWAIEPRFVYADTFQTGGVAYVKTAANRHAYIDLSGREIYSWEAESQYHWMKDMPNDSCAWDDPF